MESTLSFSYLSSTECEIMLERLFMHDEYIKQRFISRRASLGVVPGSKLAVSRSQPSYSPVPQTLHEDANQTAGAPWMRLRSTGQLRQAGRVVGRSPHSVASRGCPRARRP